jgi:acetyl-CoA C-acetyltransferase
MTACIVGWAHSRFGKLEGETLESLITKVAAEALEHAGIGPDDVGEIVLGHFNAGFSAQDFTASLVLQTDDRRPASRTPAPPGRRRCGKASARSMRERRSLCWSSARSR